MVWLLVDFLYFCYENWDLLCGNSRNPPVRAKLLLWEFRLFRIPQKITGHPHGEPAELLRLFITLLLSLKSSLRIKWKLDLVTSLEQGLKKKWNMRKIQNQAWSISGSDSWARLTPSSPSSALPLSSLSKQSHTSKFGLGFPETEMGKKKPTQNKIWTIA